MNRSVASIATVNRNLDSGHSLELQRRHTSDCPSKNKGPGDTNCTCPIWVYGRFNDKRYRRSLGLRDWSRAQKRLDKLNEDPQTIADPRTLEGCIEVYIADCRARNMEDSTITSYQRTLDHLKIYAGSRKRTLIEDIDAELLGGFRSTQKP